MATSIKTIDSVAFASANMQSADDAATVIQAHVRRCLVRSAFLTQRAAVAVIQKAWRSFACRMIYRCLRDVIYAQEAQEAKWVMRWLNVHESALVDAASGLHVRLRLGGVSFPPQIYYKLFTHRPVADICAFGPRNYAKELLDRSTTREDDWYHRVENNPWRCVDYLSLQNNAEGSFHGKDVAPDWRHFAKETREASRQRARQRRAIRWKSWMAGPLETFQEDTALLAWSQALDYDTYIKEWSRHGCSAPSVEDIPYSLADKMDV